VLGTRFLLTEESGAHPAYKQRLLEASDTTLTELFGMGWPGAHRVVANEATERWLRRDPRGPAWVRAANRLTAPLASRLQPDPHSFPVSRQRAGMPFFSPVAMTEGSPESLLEASPLYAGETVARIHELGRAGELVRALGSDRHEPSDRTGPGG
jgi:NAD(P)H-dependent flavin oxidoreductase YrpB (nitropropane dioxygenase family)